MGALGRLAGSCAVVVLAACTGGESSDGSGGPAITEAPTATTAPALTRVTDAATATSTTVPEPEPFVAGLVVPTSVADRSSTEGFGDSFTEALARLDPPVVIEVMAGAGIDDARDALQSMADLGLDLVIAHGPEFGSAVRGVATANPGTPFAWGPSGDTFGLPNVFGYGSRADEGGYVLGAAAAAGSGSGALGVVGSVEVGDGQRYVDGFSAGALAERADIVIERTYLDSFDDQELAAEAARRLVDRGADSLTSTARLTAGVSTVAVERGVPWFANRAGTAPSNPGVEVAAQVYHWDVAIEQILGRIAAGVPGGERFELTLENGGLEVVISDAGDVDPAVTAAAAAALAGLLDGSLDTGVD